MLSSFKNLNKFKAASVLTSALYFYLFISLLLFPDSFFNDLGIEGNESLYFLGRRASMLMLGFAALLFLARNTLPSVSRQVIAFSVSLNMAGFALMGTFELVRGFLDKSIFQVIAIELTDAVYFSFFFYQTDVNYKNPNDYRYIN